MVRSLTFLAVAAFTLVSADTAWAECSYTTTNISDRDEYSSTWSGTQVTSDCFLENSGSFDWNTNDYTTEETSESFYDPPSFGTKETSDASGIYTYQYEWPGYLSQNFVQTWNSHSDSLSVHQEQGTQGKAGWSVTDTLSSNNNSAYTSVGGYGYYDGLLTRDYTQSGLNSGSASSVDHAAYNGTQTVERSVSRSRFESSGSDIGSGQDFGNAYTYETSFSQKSVATGFSETLREGFLGTVISKTEQFFSRAVQAGTNVTAYANGDSFASSWSNTTTTGNRNITGGENSLSATGSDSVYTTESRNVGVGYETSNYSTSRTLASSWNRSNGGVVSSGSDYYNNSRSGSDNNFSGNRTVQDNGSTYASRSGTAGSSNYSSWYSKAWNFVNGLLVSTSEQSGESGDASLAAFYANFDPSVCEQFKDIANAQNADYAYWGLCLDTIAPSYDEPEEEPEPEPCFGKGKGHKKDKKGHGKSKGKKKGKGHKKNRCDDPSDSGKKKGKKA